MFHLVSVALYRFRVAQCAYRSNGSDQCWQHITGSVNTLRCLGYRNNHCNVECELCLTVWIAVEWRERIPSHCDRLLLDRFHDCSWDPIDSRIRIKCASERTGQSAIILPEYLMQPNSSDQRHHVSRAINAYWILHVLQVHRGCWIVRWWMCFPLYRWPLRTSVWHSMFKEKGGTLNVIVTIRQSMDLVRLHGSNCLYPLSICT